MLGLKEPEAITLISLILAPFTSGQRYRILDYMMKRYTDDFEGELEELKTTHVGQYYNEGCEPSKIVDGNANGDEIDRVALDLRLGAVHTINETPASEEEIKAKFKTAGMDCIYELPDDDLNVL